MQACTETPQPTEASLIRGHETARVLDGTSLFRGIAFGEGSVAAAIPELNEGTSADSYAENSGQLASVAWAKNEIVNRINAQDANFLDRFSIGLQSGNASTVMAYMDSAGTKLDNAMLQIAAESRARYDAQHTPGTTCGGQVLCELPNATLSHSEHLTHSGSITWDVGAAALYDTVIVNDGDVMQNLGVYLVKDLAVFYEVAGAVTVAGILNAVAAGNVNWVINVSRFWNKTRGYKLTAVSWDHAGSGQADLTQEYVSGLLATRFQAPSVFITGASRLQSGQVCTWYSNVSGGATPYTYVWKKDGSVIGSGTDLTTSFTASGTLTLTVTSATGAETASTKSVTVSSTGTCLY
jgi:SdpC family antimicrobial peptide